MTLMALEVLNPFYIFQVFSMCLWFSDAYYYYAAAILLLSSFGIAATIIQTRKVCNILLGKHKDDPLVIGLKVGT